MFDVHVRKVVVVFTAVWAAHVNAKLSALFLLLSAVVRVCVCGVISGVQKAVILEKIYAHVTVNINIYIYIINVRVRYSLHTIIFACVMKRSCDAPPPAHTWLPTYYIIYMYIIPIYILGGGQRKRTYRKSGGGGGREGGFFRNEWRTKKK